jgi:hypothetical protein
MRPSTQAEDERDLELQEELKQSLQLYLRATEADREAARALYLAKLRAFSARVFHNRAASA